MVDRIKRKPITEPVKEPKEPTATQLLRAAQAKRREEAKTPVPPNKAKKSSSLSAKEQIQAYRQDWFKWIEDYLHINTTPWPDDLPPDDWKISDGLPLTTYQRKVIEAMMKHKRVAVRSSHAVGKTFLAALVSLCILYIERAMGVTTAPTFRQVKRALWADIHKVWNRADQINKREGRPRLGGQLNRTSLEIDSGKWVLEGFSTDKDCNLQGFHERTFFLIVDEAGSVSREVYDAFDSILTNEDVYVLLIGNPTDPHNEFRNCFKPESGFYQMKIDAWMTPNVKHGRNIYPMLVAYDWPDMMLRKWKDADHPVYRSKVRAEFPLEGEDQLITWDLIQAALDRNLPDNSPITSIGLDVARQGSDTTVYGYRRMNGKFRIYRVTEQERETETAGRVKLDLDGEGPIKEINRFNRDVCVNVDDIGVGGGVSDILFEGDYPVNSIRVSESPEDWEDEDNLFLNKRACYYWRLRDAFVSGDVDIDDLELAEELHAIQKEYTSSGKIKMTAKETIKKNLGRSPDKSDSMMLAWGESDASNQRDLVRHI